MARVRIDGEAALMRKLARMPELIDEAVRPAVTEQLSEIADDERRLVRVDTGALKSSIQELPDADGLGGKVVTGERYAVFENDGAKGNPGSQFATAAGKRARREFPKRVRKHLDAALRRMGRG